MSIQKQSEEPNRSAKTYAISFHVNDGTEFRINNVGIYWLTHDPDLLVYRVAVIEITPDGTPGFRFVGKPGDCPWGTLSGSLLVAHGAALHQAVAKRLQELEIIPASFSATWACTADLAAYLNAPRDLKGAAQVLLGAAADDAVREVKTRVTRTNAERREWAERSRQYVVANAELCAHIWRRHAHTRTEKERRMSALNRRMAEGGVRVDTVALEAARESIESQLSRCPGSDAQYRRLSSFAEKLRTLQSRIRPDGMADVTSLKYCGTGTGRFSGANGFNIQAIPKGERFGVNMRALFVPAPGNVFVISDLAQIEPRVLLYLAGDSQQLAMLANGQNIYEVHARATMGYTDTKPLKTAAPDLYKLAKARVVGLGYGCGAPALRDLAAKLGLSLSEAEAQVQVSSFRRSNPKIVALWNMLERDFRRCSEQDYLMHLPSGRVVFYRDVRRGSAGLSCTVQGVEKKKYGTCLVENFVQATARDLFVEMLLAIDALPGIEIRFHVHDEVIVEVPEIYAESVKVTINKIMSTSPTWLPGCPLAAETSICNHYK